MLEQVRPSLPAQGKIGQSPEEVRLLVLKLRWMGLEDQAEELSGYLASVAPDSILAEIAATD
mgnify:CR=1 FL=1